MTTVFIGSGFVAKYPEGGGNFSVPLQYVLGARRLKRRVVWLEVMQSTGNAAKDASHARIFRERLKKFGLEKNYCLLIFPPGSEEQDLDRPRYFGMSRRRLREMLQGSNVLLNLSNSIKPPLLQKFECRKLCSLDPTEVCFWMNRMEMGQSSHDEFWTIGLNAYGKGSRVPETSVKWQTYFPLVDTAYLRALPHPVAPRFTTIGQWYWDGMVEFDGEWRDFSKRAAFEKFMGIPAALPEVEMELAMNFTPTDPEPHRITSLGWSYVHPHRIARTPQLYYDYVAGSIAEFTAVKLESATRSGWLSDRSAIYLALGRPVITESTGAEPYLPGKSGYLFVSNLEEACEAIRRVVRDWKPLSRAARASAVECFDAARGMQRLLA